MIITIIFICIEEKCHYEKSIQRAFGGEKRLRLEVLKMNSEHLVWLTLHQRLHPVRCADVMNKYDIDKVLFVRIV